MGPLTGTRIVEIAGLGPAPVCGMMLADMGAEVILVQRKASKAAVSDVVTNGRYAIPNRGKQSITLDLKQDADIEVVLDLVAGADGLIEGFRPGVMERLGLGPEICQKRNPRLVYGRMTGWGQFGPLSQAAGHDINYIALSGTLYYTSQKDRPPFPPPGVIGDVGGGAYMLTIGMLAGIINAKTTGKGQVVDTAITDGSAIMNALMLPFHQSGAWSNDRGSNLLDGGSPWYNSYECADGGYITFGAVEPQFYALLIEACGLEDDPTFAHQYDASTWPQGIEKMKTLVKTKTRDEWCEIMEGTDICFAPVLNWDEAMNHAHNQARETYIEIEGVKQPAPAPRFSETPSAVQGQPPEAGEQTRTILEGLGYDEDRIKGLMGSG